MTLTLRKHAQSSQRMPKTLKSLKFAQGLAILARGVNSSASGSRG